ncbi:transcription factor bhlh130 [Phtheirospermum japonicum]|uniref:Transcription factor bhlh130 n=1 Tax=Phtheirospermum japonicum TaxID=374723 RepID=A0A830D7U8_9LAMI|nr:transcription factor bhlh130 [Phtheirospermum japonicum]
MFSSERSSGEFLKSREFNGSDFFQNQNDHPGPGLARYRSAPSSFLAALLDSNTDNNNSSSGDESDAFFSALIDGPIDLNQKNNSDNHPGQYSMKQEIVAETEPRPGLCPNGQTGGYVGSYSVGMENQVHVNLSNNGNGNRNCSSLVRQSSSPAGIFNGFGVMGEVGGDYRVHNHTETSSSAGGFTNHLNFSSGPSSSSRFMPTIPENVNENIPKNVRPRNGNNSSWDESPLKRNRDGDLKMFSNFNGLENQNGGSRKTSTGLVSHMSLPKTSNEMAVVENYLHFQQETTTTTIPCQVRAKRGFATHPRSIAERMRRTRISDNMKKLQDLFPNMDKQTNTAEMLDLAVDYIKDLQKQVQTLTDKKAKCVCSNKPQQRSPTT